MKILTWNIRQGGSTKRLENIIARIKGHSPDVLVITEYWEGEKGQFIQEGLRNIGYDYQQTSNPPFKSNGILVASRYQIELLLSSYNGSEALERWIEIHISACDLHVLALHIPTEGSTLHNKQAFWSEVKQFAERHKSNRTVIVGDFNTGLGDDAEGVPLVCREVMQEVLDMGWIDSWRFTHGNFRQYSWFSSKGNGFRIDHIFLSPILKQYLVEAYFSHDERISKVSDHSVLVAELIL